MNSIYNKEIFPVDSWPRAQQFHFFKDFTQPFFNVHTEVDLTTLYHYCHQHGISIFMGYLHATRQSACAVENFLLRIEDGQVVKFAGLDLSTTVLKQDQTIAFAHLPHQDDLREFCTQGQSILAEIRESKELFHGHQGIDMMHLTTLPWFKFNGVEHAFNTNPKNPGVPKIAFGRLEKQDGKVTLPLSIGLHHALADGYHVHLFLEQLQKTINSYA